MVKLSPYGDRFDDVKIVFDNEDELYFEEHGGDTENMWKVQLPDESMFQITMEEATYIIEKIIDGQ